MSSRMFIITISFLMLSMSVLAATAAGTPETAKTIRATALDGKMLSLLQKGEVQDITVEFRELDRLPVNIKAEGDLFKSIDETPVYLEIQKNFFIRIKSNSITMSFDGEVFKPLKDMIGGSISAGASSDNGDISDFPGSAINIVFRSYIK